MPSKKRQLNIRLDDDDEDRLARLVPLVSAALGLKLSQSDIVRLAFIALEEKHTPKEPTKKGNKK